MSTIFRSESDLEVALYCKPGSRTSSPNSCARSAAQHYHDKHPFHRLMNEGRLNREQIRLWVANRFYYQKNIPIKDALLLARCPLREVRRRWVQRILDHDGTGDDPGGIEKWLRLGEAGRPEPRRTRRRSAAFARRAFRRRCLCELRRHAAVDRGRGVVADGAVAPPLMTERLAAFEKHYTWIDPAGPGLFRSRPPLATRDSDHGLSLVLEHCRTREEQERAVAALQDASATCCVASSMRCTIIASPPREITDVSSEPAIRRPSSSATRVIAGTSSASSTSWCFPRASWS